MDGRRRRSMRELHSQDLPTAAGVYALYCNGKRMYVGKAGSLRERIWKSHSSRGGSMRNSAMRRNVAEYLGIASADDIYHGAHKPAPAEVARVREWLDGCELAWVECPSEPAARALETEMKAEHLPPLTKR
jgi:hypothetical protein